MPAFRNIRRSRRISKQPPRDPSTDEYDVYDLELMYPDSDGVDSDPAPSSSPPTRDPPLPLVDPQSPHPSLLSCSGSSPTRSSHSRKKKPGHIPRPPNAFLIFRSELWNKEKIKGSVERDHRQISRIAGRYWQELSDAERAPYHVLAEKAKRDHAELYPDYKYSPVYRKDKATKRKAKAEDTEKVLRCQRVALLMRQGFVGDDLKRELEKADAPEDDDTSDASDYVEAPRRKRARTRKSYTKKPSSAQRSRRSRDISASVKEEVMDENDIPPEHLVSPVVDTLILDAHTSSSPIVDCPVSNVDPVVNSPALDVTPKQEQSTPLIHDHGGFVPQDEIPELRLGSPAFSPKVEFTNPFAEDSGSPSRNDAAFFTCDPLSPVISPLHASPSSDFLGVAFDEAPVSMEASNLDCTYDVELFDVKGDPLRPAVDCLKPDYSTMFGAEDIYSFYLNDYTNDEPSDHVFSDWVDM
ncbi:transcription factor [Ganoderma sinense ZZ0214-1]|uniref:Transcription factor n=1 Tax=Ganoderma sinense ZZ0214-1 TaxID=1077348 RepID=A0A2G8SAX3_9APHY|nr:transcription factor [Ganoderma sinense ZZ0214-1]